MRVDNMTGSEGVESSCSAVAVIGSGGAGASWVSPVHGHVPSTSVSQRLLPVFMSRFLRFLRSWGLWWLLSDPGEHDA